MSVVKPLKGQEEQVRALLEELNQFAAAQAGYLEGYVFEGTDGAGAMGRVSVWDSPASANRAAQGGRTLALRASIQRRLEEDLVEGMYALTASTPLPVRSAA